MPAVSVLATTSTEIVPVDYNRSLVFIVNTDTAANIHINFGIPVTTNEAYLSPGGNMTLTGERAKCAINGISSSGTVIAKYSKLSAGI